MRILIFIFLMMFSVPAFALQVDQNSDGTTRTIADYIEQYVDVPKGATDWKVFGKTKEIEIKGKDKDGYDYDYSKPGFTPEVEAMNGKPVTVKGFMFPLDESEQQSYFLIGPFPVTCPFHYHVGPSLVIEVHTDKKQTVKFSYDPVVITGTLELVRDDPDYETFYRLNNAHQVK